MSAALIVLEQLRAADSALRRYIDAKLACEICLNPKHEWHAEAHGGACQDWPFALIDKYDDACAALEAKKRMNRFYEKTLDDLAAAAEAFGEREDLWPTAPDAANAAFEDTILEPLRRVTAEL